MSTLKAWDEVLNDWRAISTGSRGLEGPSGEGFLSGDGPPNGVVAAPPGTFYRDRVVSGTGNNALIGTNGAYLWVKRSGTGNTDWVVSRGYTGRRLVNSWVVNGDDLAYPQTYVSGNLWVERLDNTVIFSSWFLNSSTNLAIKVETGFLWQGAPNQMTARLTVNRWDSTAQHPLLPIAGRPILYHGGASPYAIAPNSRVTISGSYTTNDPWPATLPGTAVNF